MFQVKELGRQRIIKGHVGLGGLSAFEKVVAIFAVVFEAGRQINATFFHIIHIAEHLQVQPEKIAADGVDDEASACRADEFVFAIAHGGIVHGLYAIMGPLPEADGRFVAGIPTQRFHDIRTVHVGIVRQGSAGRIAEGRHPVGKMHQVITDSSARKSARGPMHNRGDANAAFPDRAFAPAHVAIGSPHAFVLNGSVVAGKPDQRVLAQTQFIQTFQNLLHAAIDGAQHGVERTDRFIEESGVAENLDVRLVGLVGRMGSVVRQVQKERLLAVAAYKRQRLVGQHIRQVTSVGALLIDTVDFQVPVPVVHHRSLKGDGFMEAAPGRMTGARTNMPFTDGGGAISGACQMLRDGQGFGVVVFKRAMVRMVACADALRVAPGHQRGARRHAYTGRRILLGAGDAFLHERVEAIGLAAMLVECRHVADPHIVHNNLYNVWRVSVHEIMPPFFKRLKKDFGTKRAE